MIKIEDISVKDKYSISLCFNKDYSNEYIYFGTETDRRRFFSKGIYEKSENKKFKRNFGTFIEDSLRFAESDNLRAVRKCADGLAAVLRQGRGLDQIEPYKAELFRIYNGSDNIVEQYVILKLWHEHTVKHNELNKILTSINPKNWTKFGELYATYVDKMLLPFEKPFTSVDDVKELSGNIYTDIVEIEKMAAVCYTCEVDILPLYMIYFTELSQRNKHILTCDVCGRKFVASRKDTKVCGEGCKTVKQNWVYVTYNGKSGYASGKYLSTTKPANSNNTSNNTSNNSSSSNSSSSATYTAYPKGTDGSLNIRNAPKTGKVIGSIPEGAACTVTPSKNKDGWYYVTYKGVSGYASGNYLTKTKPSSNQSNTRTGVVKGADGYLNINSKPASGNSIGKIPEGASCTVYPNKTSGNWYWVSYNGVSGYAYSKYIVLK